jgi:hypothetical protein
MSNRTLSRPSSSGVAGPSRSSDDVEVSECLLSLPCNSAASSSSSQTSSMVASGPEYWSRSKLSVEMLYGSTIVTVAGSSSSESVDVRRVTGFRWFSSNVPQQGRWGLLGIDGLVYAKRSNKADSLKVSGSTRTFTLSMLDRKRMGLTRNRQHRLSRTRIRQAQ